jgi:hypothetical protein
VIPGNPASVGRAVLANRDAVLIRSLSIRLLISAAIERARAEGSNSANVPELEVIPSAVEGLHQVLLATTAPVEAAVGDKAISFRDGLAA